jgi:hypothetical protein
MSKLTAEEITNLYLYGTKTIPSDLTSESLIRPLNVKPTTTTVDMNEYMATAGRFASANVAIRSLLIRN